MGSIVRISSLILMTLLLSACPLKDWIRSDDERVSVEEFKRITKVVSVHNQQNKASVGNESHSKQDEISRLFFLLSQYRASNETEKKVLFSKIEGDFRQNPTLLNALFLSMIQVTINKNSDELALNSNLMKAIDLSAADSDLLQLMNLFKVLNSVQAEKLNLKNKLKLYKVENSKQKKEVQELTAQINALKKIEESIFQRELVLDSQE